MKAFLFFIVCFLSVAFLLNSCAKGGTGYGTTGGGGGGGGTANSVSMAGNSFSPSSLTVKKGAVVKWTNKDYGSHTVTSDDGTSFNSGDIPAGGSYSYTATIIDTFDYHCTIHGASMSGTLIVIP